MDSERAESGLRILLFCTLISLMPLSSTAADRLRVYTVNYPLQYFAERIGGDHAEVNFPAPGDVDPAFWMPDIEILVAYQSADLIILNGAGYAKWVNKVSLPRLRLVDTSLAFRDGLISEKGTVTHRHGPGGEHSHFGTAFTTWLDFDQAIQQARAILEALQRKRPAARAYFSDNFKRLERDLRALDREMLSFSEKAPGLRFMASHPIYQYLARRYRMDLTAMSWEPEEFPSDNQWQLFSEQLQQQPAGWMLWEGKPLEKTRQRLSEKGVSVVVFSPVMNLPDDGDFLSVMKQNVKNLKQAANRGSGRQ